VTNLHRLTTHSTLCTPHKMEIVTSRHPMQIISATPHTTWRSVGRLDTGKQPKFSVTAQ